jgi:hypothetical protein
MILPIIARRFTYAALSALRCSLAILPPVALATQVKFNRYQRRRVAATLKTYI